jgi:hypothetical protein
MEETPFRADFAIQRRDGGCSVHVFVGKPGVCVGELIMTKEQAEAFHAQLEHGAGVKPEGSELDREQIAKAITAEFSRTWDTMNRFWPGAEIDLSKTKQHVAFKRGIAAGLLSAEKIVRGER